MRLRTNALGLLAIAVPLVLAAVATPALARSGKLADATVFISSATDPYQGLERRPRGGGGARDQLHPRPGRQPRPDREIAVAGDEWGHERQQCSEVGREIDVHVGDDG